MGRNDLCFCGSGKKRKKCHRDIEEGSAFATLIQLHQRLDATIEEKAGNIRCHKGCYACCSQYFTISPVEFYYIISQIIETQGMEKAQAFIDKGYEDYLYYSEKYPDIIDFLKENQVSNNTIDTLTYLQRRIDLDRQMPMNNPHPCPFLDPDTKECSVYEFRPTVCRTYGVAYETKLETPFMICEKIPDGLEYQKEMADVSEYSDDIESLHCVSVGGQMVFDRTYPIFYFCKIVKEKPQFLTTKISEFKSYSLEDVVKRKLKRNALI